MKKAILIFPFIKARAIQYPTGLYKIATYCKNNYDVIIIDARIDKEIDETIRKILFFNDDILCIGLSVMTGEQIKEATRISKLFCESVPIVWGGIHPTILPEQTINNYFVNYVVIGEGEAGFLNVLEFIDKGHVSIPLFLSKSNNNYTHNLLSNLNLVEYVDFTKYQINQEYFLKRDGFKKAFTIETSRGCPFHCAYCYNSIFAKPYRSIDAEYSKKIINFLHDHYNIDGIIFQEDNFFIDINRVNSILEFIKSLSFLGWKSNCRIDIMAKNIGNSKLLKLICDSRCHVLQFGVESGSNRILSLINKKLSVDNVIEFNKMISDYPIKIRYNFIVGFPTETKTEIENTLRLINKLQHDNRYVEPPFLNIYTPYPGTPLYSMALKYGLNEPKSTEEWSEFNWNQFKGPWLSEELYKYIANLSNNFFIKSHYLRELH